MKVSGFTFVRNVVKYDYPVVESIRSILPMVDEFIVNVGRCDDGTLEMIRSIGDPKIRIVESVWDETLRKDRRHRTRDQKRRYSQVHEACNRGEAVIGMQRGEH